MLVVRRADFSEHKTICAIAKQHKFTRDFSNMIFSGEDCYKAGRIRVLVDRAATGDLILGFTCFRVRKRDGVTVLYFIAVDKELAGGGHGRKLMHDLERGAKGGVELKVNKANPAVQFYLHLGYEELGEAYHGEGLTLGKGIPPKAASEALRSSKSKRK